jgi:hypothetical protein
MISTDVTSAVSARLGASLPAGLIESLGPYLSVELLGDLADLAVDLHVRRPAATGRGQHAVTFADI